MDPQKGWQRIHIAREPHATEQLATSASMPCIRDICHPTRDTGARMRHRTLLALSLALPSALAAQASAGMQSRDGVMAAFENFANIFGGQLIAAFDSIPATRYAYRPTPTQQSIGFIAQHIENANYGLCERLGPLQHRRTGKDSLPDTVKATWPKDTLIARLKASLAFCDSAFGGIAKLEDVSRASNLLGFQTDLAEHYAQISGYMRQLGMLPPTALPRRERTAITVPASTLPAYVGVYEVGPGFQIVVTMNDGELFVQSNRGGAAVRLWPERQDEFFVKEVDAQITFTRDAGRAVTGLVLHQYSRDRPARKIR
jgi:hypothetical protein